MRPGSPGAAPAADAGTAASRQITPYILLVLLGALPLLALAVFAYAMSARAVENLVRAGNDAAATITAAMVERESESWIATLRSHAGFPSFSAAVSGGDVHEVRRRLHIFVNAHPRLDRAFVTDPAGLLWADYPEAPESLGRHFNDRDWYRGVTDSGRPYVSRVYRRNAKPQLLVVAVAVPVHDPVTGEVAGLAVAQVRLDDLSGLLQRVEVGAGGIALLLDHSGTAVGHPGLDVQHTIHREYASVLDVFTDAGNEGVVQVRYTDPPTGERVLGSAVSARVQDHDWTVIAQQPVATAFASSRTLAWQLGTAGLLMAGLMAALILALTREIARRQSAEQALAAMNRELEARVEQRTAALRQKEEELLQAQKMEAIGKLAGGVAHDFNNLLTVILGSTELLLDRLPADSGERCELERMQDAGEQAANLTRQLLAFSRKQVMQPEVLDLNEIVEGMRSILDRVMGEDIELVWKLSPGLHPVKFDPGKIEQVVMNLVVNARDAMPRGGKITIGTGNVELDEDYVNEHPDAQRGPHAMLAVSDTGAGMDAETRKRIFDPFFTTKKLGHGTGLGLSTVYGIVRQGGGNIWVYSEPGHGTTFKVYLPRTDEGPAAPAHEPSPVERPATGTVLLVEDEPGVRALLVRVLTEAGYRVLEAEDAEAARRTFAGNDGQVDLLLTDVVLPGTGGPEVAAELGGLQPGLKVLYMSGYTDDAIVHHGMLDEGAAFIEKPLRPRSILEKVREVLTA